MVSLMSPILLSLLSVQSTDLLLIEVLVKRQIFEANI